MRKENRGELESSARFSKPRVIWGQRDNQRDTAPKNRPKNSL